MQMNFFRPLAMNPTPRGFPRFVWRRGHQPRGLSAAQLRLRGADRPASNFEKARAFSLVEVLVALAIFALASMVLVGAFVNVLNAQNTALRRDENGAAVRLIREALYAEPLLENIERWNDIKLPDDGRGRWQATVEPTTVADLFQVTLEAELDLGRGKDRLTVTETFRLLRPTWSLAVDRETLRSDARSKLAERKF
ncbi:type II secretion system protein [Oleiharenicola lentus]|uniref:type II secretion system protein n=1 Tax=Oleiharenicola lentus TaxID=2508720 RepID=UPI003F679FB5